MNKDTWLRLTRSQQLGNIGSEIARLREVIGAWFCDQKFFDIHPKEIDNPLG